MIVNGDVGVLPPDTPAVALPGAIAGDAMADTIEPTELFNVDMDDLAGCGALVARPRLLRFKGAQETEAARLEDARDSSHRKPQRAGNVLLGAALTAQSLDGGPGGERRLAGRCKRFGGAVPQAIHAQGADALYPLGHRRWRRIKLACRRCFAEPVIHHSAGHVLSTFRRQPGILVSVHSALQRITEVWQHQSSWSGPNGQPPESSHLERNRFTAPVILKCHPREGGDRVTPAMLRSTGSPPSRGRQARV